MKEFNLEEYLKNPNMKTIEERALEYARMSGINPDIDYFDFCQQDYIAGAEEQKVIDINKACEWLDTYFMEIGYPDDWLRDSHNMESGKERFRRAMEE